MKIETIRKKRSVKLNSAFFGALLLISLIIITGCGGGGGSGSLGVIGGDSGGGTENTGGGENENPGPNPGGGVIDLNWSAPTTNSDGSPLTDLGGYNVYYGGSSGNYAASVDVGNTTSFTMSSLAPGTYCFALTAYDTSGNESGYSSEICKTV